MTKERILFVGQHPDCFSGNGNMLGAMIEDLDTEKYDACIFAKDEVPVPLLGDPFTQEYDLPCKVIPAYEERSQDPWGRGKLLSFIDQIRIDQLVFVGIDIWRYVEIFESIKKLQKIHKFSWKAIAPYDLDHIREDWLTWFSFPDEVYVYSMFGYNMLKPYLSNVKFFRPRLRFDNLYYPLPDEERKDVRDKLFSDIDEDDFVYIFVGNNQLRKNIYNTVVGFAEAVKEDPNIVLYMHMNNVDHIFSIERLKKELDIPEGRLKHNANSRKLFPHEMNLVYNACDCHLLASLQEGLSWTVVESKLCGLPSLLSETTAHHDFINRETVLPIPCNTEEFITLPTEYGPSYIQVKAPSKADVRNGILQAKETINWVKEDIKDEARKRGEEWIESCDDINDILFHSTFTKQNIGEFI